ncbi:halocyanin domain-containing protein [Halorubrum tebenquichense]|uniref:Halocyanin domain protein n=1 Tax=Halorubrum tebenquichense DSM 14210 TaxID=1227485 RepID=M0DXR3_9EURY|nr:halocyanin domain-containing protein [Halorubrum tebenquichense]ELZ39573.1 halocyanin domain protein [Halorubrum tebenquichense DSM 14210]
MSDKLSRRRYLAGTGAALTIGTLAGCSGGGDGGDGSDGSDGDDGMDGSDGGDGGDVPSEIDDYLADANQYDGSIEDLTGQDEVTIEVGTGDVGYGFSPAAIRIDSGTTVVWEWTGNGGGHNVASVEDSESDFDNGEIIGEEGYTFEQSFDNTGIQLYECTPHSANGMLGAIEVVEA